MVNLPDATSQQNHPHCRSADRRGSPALVFPTANATLKKRPPMNGTEPHLPGLMAKAVQVHTEPENPIDAIVWAAYRKFARGGKIREAVNHCLEEDHAKLKRRTSP
jgi:hypothetical protein